jgi:GTPase SAR1 family protein
VAAPEKKVDPDAKDLFTFASKQKVKSKQTCKTFVVLGDPKSGKSSLISKFLEMGVKEDMPETFALKYMSGTKEKDRQKVKVSFYELGGGHTYADLLEAAIVSPGSPDTTTICVCIDLSKPKNCVGTLRGWLKQIRELSA